MCLLGVFAIFVLVERIDSVNVPIGTPYYEKPLEILSWNNTGFFWYLKKGTLSAQLGTISPHIPEETQQYPFGCQLS